GVARGGRRRRRRESRVGWIRHWQHTLPDGLDRPRPRWASNTDVARPTRCYDPARNADDDPTRRVDDDDERGRIDDLDYTHEHDDERGRIHDLDHRRRQLDD